MQRMRQQPLVYRMRNKISEGVGDFNDVSGRSSIILLSVMKSPCICRIFEAIQCLLQTLTFRVICQFLRIMAE